MYEKRNVEMNGSPDNMHETDSGDLPSDLFTQLQNAGQRVFYVVGNNPRYEHPFPSEGGNMLQFTELPQPQPPPPPPPPSLTHTISNGLVDGSTVHSTNENGRDNWLVLVGVGRIYYVN